MKNLKRTLISSFFILTSITTLSHGEEADIFVNEDLQENLPFTLLENQLFSTDSIYTDTLFSGYFNFFSSAKYDYLTVKRLENQPDSLNLPTSEPSFSDYQAESYRNAALNRAVIHDILNKITEENQSSDDRILAIYDFLMYNFIRDDTDRESPAPSHLQIYYNKDLVTAVDNGTYLLKSGTGGCVEFASLLHRMLATSGFPSFEVYGYYVNRDGSSLWHAFNRAKVDGTWYWYDVDVEGSVYRRGDVASPIYYLYKKDTAYWHDNHTWEEAEVTATEQLYDNTPVRSSGEIFSYELPTKVTIDGMDFTSSSPFYGYVDFDTLDITESVMFLQLDDLMNFIGLSYSWNAEKGCIEVIDNSSTVELKLNASTYWKNGEEHLMALPLRVIDGKDYMSVDDFSLIFDYDMNVQFYKQNDVILQSVMFQDRNPSISYEKLENAVQNTSYHTNIPNINSTTTLISGKMPSGMGLYPDGTIGGVPKETGTFQFSVGTSAGEVGYSITVEAPSVYNVGKNNDFSIIQPVNTVENNDSFQIFEVSGEYENFLNLYLNGNLLVENIDYITAEGSTKITISAQTLAQLEQGSHTINATFSPTSLGTNGNSTLSSSQPVTVKKVAQVFEKTVDASPMMAMPFTDVTVSDWHYQYVRYMYDTGTFSGITDTTYEPNTGMTRGMMAVVFYGMANNPTTKSANFSDVSEADWYADAVNWIAISGIDDSTGSFRPKELITREETAKMMYNFCENQGIFLPLTTSRTPSDIDSVSWNAKNAVNILFSKGIFAGDDANNFNPQNTSTRAEISAMMRTFMWSTL